MHSPLDTTTPPMFFHDWHDCGVLYWFCWILTHCAGVQVDECRVQRHPGLDLFEAQHLPDASLSADQEQHAQTVTTEIVCAHFRKILIATVISVSRRAGYIRCRTSATSSRRATCASHCCRWPSASTWIASTSASLPAPYVRTNRVPIGAAEYSPQSIFCVCADSRRGVPHSERDPLQSGLTAAHDDRGAVRSVHDGHGVLQRAPGAATAATDAGDDLQQFRRSQQKWVEVDATWFDCVFLNIFYIWIR